MGRTWHASNAPKKNKKPLRAFRAQLGLANRERCPRGRSTQSMRRWNVGGAPWTPNGTPGTEIAPPGLWKPSSPWLGGWGVPASTPLWGPGGRCNELAPGVWSARQYGAWSRHRILRSHWASWSRCRTAKVPLGLGASTMRLDQALLEDSMMPISSIFFT